MPLVASKEDVKAMLTLTNLRKWVETWPQKYIGIRGSQISCPIGMYLSEGEGVVSVRVSSRYVDWHNTSLEQLKNLRKTKEGEMGYNNIYSYESLDLPLELQQFIKFVDKGANPSKIQKVQKSTVLRYLDQLMCRRGVGEYGHLGCISNKCVLSGRSTS